MSGNPVSKPVNVQVITMDWVDFKGPMLEKLAIGTYALLPKARVTPEVPGVEQCSPEDQWMFSQVDAMEISMLDTAIEAKLREVNTGGKGDLILDKIAGAMSEDVPHGKTLYVFDTPWWTDARKLELLRDLGGMLEMRYEKILVAVDIK